MIERVTEIDELGELLDALLEHSRRQAVEASLEPQELHSGLFRVERDVLQRDADA